MLLLPKREASPQPGLLLFLDKNPKLSFMSFSKTLVPLIKERDKLWKLLSLSLITF